VAKNNTTFRLKDAKELTYAAFGKITKDVWTKAEEHVARFVFGFRLDYKLFLFIFYLLCVKLFCVLFMCYNQYIKNQNKQRQRSKLQIPVLDKHFEVE
jgi:hypothetical protein